ncbi:sensor histidine kinase [Chitinophaga niabensis]|uniref:Signal transduction histidine kinase n=1 Tax=Chitinophaga niabensis TaxID=536979 RepID=A0A1N6F7F0_9BACT|nr:7TM diverse intracellular signaling domain-containing protein [Chitinophaga niabensis]SIN91180.1 Signal transduction histidine kinase [Chitinophaga niabensis]
MRRAYLLLSFIFLYGIQQLQAQHGQVFKVWEDSTRIQAAPSALNHYYKGDFTPLPGENLNPGFTKSVFWIALTVPPTPENLLLITDNAHINILEWYAVHDSVPMPLYVTGDFFPFAQRPVIHNTFVFPLQPKTALYLLRVDKHFESLQAPLRLVTQEQLAQEMASENLLSGLFTGIMLLIVLFGAFLFFTTSDRVYGYYALYVLSILLWIWANKGLGFHYLWPESWFFPSRARPVFVVTNMLLVFQFLQYFIGIKKDNWAYRPFKIFQAIGLCFLVAILWPTDYARFGMISMILQKMLTLFSLCAVALVAGNLLQKVWQRNTAATVYLVATMVLLVFITIEIMYYLGKLEIPVYFVHFGVFTGAALEVIIITFALAARFNNYRKEKETVLRTLTDTIIAVEEKERKILADQLHDEIGSMLSLASLNMQAMKLDEVTEMLDQLSHTVRHISHQLTPVAIEKYGLRHAIEDLVKIANGTGKINIELVLIGFSPTTPYPSNTEFTIYRIIQELLQNILKHAEASNVLIQLIEIELEKSCSIIVEDNGIGIDPATILRSVEAKVAYMEGKIMIESKPNEGAMVNIELPLPEKITV